MTPLFTILAFAPQAALSLNVDLHAPERVMSGLPLVVGCTLRNDGDTSVYANLGTNRAGWLAAKILDPDGRVVARSVPEASLPTTNREHNLSPGPRFEPKQSREISVSLRMDTSALEAGVYTVTYDLDLPVAADRLGVFEGEGRKPTHLCVYAEAPLAVERNASAVESQAKGIIQTILASPGANNGEAIRQLMLIDHRVSVPLVAAVGSTRWTNDQISYFLRETAPYASLTDARWLKQIVRPGVRSWALGALSLMRRSERTGVAEIGGDIGRRLGALQP